MEEKHRKAIQKNFSSLVEQTDLDSLVTALYEKGVFSALMTEPYRDKNVSERHRKRTLYRDIERRGPHAFPLLVDALRETGHWTLVRLLAPDSILRPHAPTYSLHPVYRPGEQVSSGEETPQQPLPPPPQPPPAPTDVRVVLSREFAADVDCYRTRTRRRGIALIITNARFDNDIADPRPGADADHANLKELFSQIGFHKTLAYTDVTYQQMKQTIECFTQLAELERTECVFVVVGSHGYARSDTNDVDIRCSDGRLISTYYIVEQFNNKNCPKLHNIPKVFIFQYCRGKEQDRREPPTSRAEAGRAPQTDGATPLRPDRLYSDILIAYATIPGFVSYRDPVEGSWYVQCVCRVFAERAHDTHVDALLSLVDERLRTDYRHQTSSVERWGFNRRLYLHPGLFEDAKS